MMGLVLALLLSLDSIAALLRNHASGSAVGRATRASRPRTSLVTYNSPQQLCSDFLLGAATMENPTSTLITSAVNAWSVSGSTLNSEDLASSLFASSLFPYLAFLYFLGRPQSSTPPIGNFGFRFLLLFVGATIPAGIYAKVQYHDILANVDWLHGSAESLLTVTNLLIILGFRSTRPTPTQKDQPLLDNGQQQRLFDAAIPVMLSLPLLLALSASMHPEPANALSIPTWMVHSSSLIEWLAAMSLIWQHAETSNNPRWKGLTWAMIPSHTSGICACTYHLFYNAPVLSWLVALQAGLTLLGNTCLALAAYRISTFQSQSQSQSNASASVSADSSAPAASSPRPLPDSNLDFGMSLFAKSLAVAVVVKYGELFLDVPFQEDPSLVAGAILVTSTLINVARWTIRSRGEEDREGERVGAGAGAGAKSRRLN